MILHNKSYTITVIFVFLLLIISCKKDTENTLTIPILTTKNIVSVTAESAITGGTVINDGGSLITQRGVCWNTSPNATINNNKAFDGSTGSGNFTTNISGLSGNTTYYIRAYATNSIGTGYGNEISFTTLIPCGTPVTDADGNTYSSVKIGNQCWMAENLKTLPAVTGAEVGSQTTPYYYVNGYSGTNVNEARATANFATYGVLYNWAAVMGGEPSSEANPSGVKGICPEGWHVPSNDEWTELLNFLGGETVAGGKLKETGTTHWFSTHPEATNESGFTALPGESRLDHGIFNAPGFYGYWWSATDVSAVQDLAYSLNIGCHGATVYRYDVDKSNGFSVRCVRPC